MNSALKALIGFLLAVILTASGFIGGYVTGKWDFGTPSVLRASQDEDVVLERIDEVRDLLDRQALKPPSETSATAGAIQGLLASGGDDYALYFDDQHYGYFNEEMNGEFGGIGVSLGEGEYGAYVVEVFEGTPADKGGVKAGDVFVQIDDVRRAKWSTDEVVKRVRGKEGTKVAIVLIRPGKKDMPGEEMSFSLVREIITFPNTTSELKGTVGYVETAQFNGNATAEISDAVAKLAKKGAKSFVLDLRNNPGGSLEQAVSVSSLFVDEGVIVRVAERGRDEIEHHSMGQKITSAPLVVLVNGNSASASEIVAGALQDYERATIVGETTFGKGSVQTVKELSFGGAVKFTTAHYLTPKKRAIDGKGLTPDVVVKMDIEKQMDEKTDVQLKKALEIAAKAR